MGQALYRKYRSKSLDEIVGQEHVTKTLKNALKTGNISHAYLFTGPRGVGKTSVARILAHAVNSIDYSDDSVHLDIIEIDAASNRRIDEIRDLRDKVHLSPTSSKYKVYIIDEVHMLTKEAFNALLKTLEEPPAHVIFILATTEAHKLPETIVSRTQRFTFRPISQKEITSHLKAVAEQEHIKISDEALSLIAEHGEGTLRDSISMLDQVSSGTKGEIDEDSVRSMLGIAPSTIVDELISAVASGEAKKCTEIVSSLYEQGFQAGQLSKQLSKQLRAMLGQDGTALNTAQIIELLKHLVDVPSSNDPQQMLELVLLDVALVDAGDTPKPAPTVSQNKNGQQNIPNASDKPKAKMQSPSKFSLDSWPEVLETIKNTHNTLNGILRMAAPAFDEKTGTLTLTFSFPFHKKRIDEPKSRQILSDVLSNFGGDKVTVLTKVSKNQEVAAPLVEPEDHISSINSVFGSTEVLEG